MGLQVRLLFFLSFILRCELQLTFNSYPQIELIVDVREFEHVTEYCRPIEKIFALNSTNNRIYHTAKETKGPKGGENPRDRKPN